jgi:hypothetical protein
MQRLIVPAMRAAITIPAAIRRESKTGYGKHGGDVVARIAKFGAIGTSAMSR